jgi:outer membrane receptor protein involved in Fe transport
MSFDIRAPDLYELFNTGLPRAGTSVDPKTGQGVQIFTLAGGNPNLVPELARTISGGAVLTPHWVPGLTVAADWYSISITGAIVTIPTKTILDNCKAGQQLYCDQLVFGGANGALSVVKSNPLNVDAQSVSGLDFQADYVTDLFGNNLSLHMVGNYTDEQSETTQGVPYDYAGSVGGDSQYQGVPKFRSTLSATYSMGAWQGTIQSRIIGSARLVNTWTNLNVDNNEVPAVAYLDLRASYRWSDNIQLYAALDNALDAPPPVVVSTSNTGSGGSGTRDDLYAAYGREFRLGIRLNY